MADEATETHDRDPFAPGSLGELVPDLWFDPKAWPDYEPEAPLSADEALERYLDWCGFWADFLEDTTLVDGRRVYTHERLRKARRSLSSLVSAWSRRSGKPHGVVHSELRSSCGGPEVAQARTEEIEARIALLRRWFVGRR